MAVRAEGADQFTADDDTMLAELARQVGLALHNVELDSALQKSLDELRQQAEELQASRARIVAASDAARRQIERNLHDGAQQHLVALAVNVRLARKLAETDPEASLEILDQLGSGLQNAVQELRALAHGIYPPLLVDRGIEEALRSAAGRAALPAEVEASGLSRQPPEVEAAVYFCCLEALQNAGKHAGDGASVTVRVWEEPGCPVLRGGRRRRRLRREREQGQGRRLRQHERPGGGHGRRRAGAVGARPGHDGIGPDPPRPAASPVEGRLGRRHGQQAAEAPFGAGDR